MTPRILSSQDLEPSMTSTTRQREPGVKSRRVAMATHDELTNDHIAWPTLILFAASLSTYLLPILLFRNNPTYWTVPVTAVATYTMFTAMHEAAHRAISAEYRWVNELIGHISSLICFQAPFQAFRFIHLSHHKYTNDPQKDPDHWSAGHGPKWVQPFFWCTQTLHYYCRYFRDISTRPLDEAAEAVVVTVVILLSVSSLLSRGCGRQLLVFVGLPRMITDPCLAYSFDYAPHHPHEASRAEDVYGCTAMIGGLLSPDDGVDLTVPLIYQNYHNIHHLYPTIPFYKYPCMWRNHRKILLELGTPVGSWFGPLVAKRGQGGTEGKKVGEEKEKEEEEEQQQRDYHVHAQ